MKYAMPLHIEEAHKMAFEVIQTHLQRVFEAGSMSLVHGFIHQVDKIRLKAHKAAQREVGFDEAQTELLQSVYLYNEVPAMANEMIDRHNRLREAKQRLN